MSPRPINTTQMEDTDVPASAFRSKPIRHYRRRAPRPVQPRRLTTWEGFKTTLRESAWFLLGLVALLAAVANINAGNVVATTDADVFGPDEMYHRAQERYSHE